MNDIEIYSGTHPESIEVCVIWGKCSNYSPASNEVFNWDGELRLSGGGRWLDQQNYQFAGWVQTHEASVRLCDIGRGALLEIWRQNPVMEVGCASGGSGWTRGIRFRVKGDEST